MMMLLFSKIDYIAAQVTTTKVDSSSKIPDTLLFRIQRAQAAITEMNASNKKGYDLGEFSRRISDIQTDIDPLKKSFKNKGAVQETKSLMSYDLILRDAEARLKTITAALVKSSNDLQRMSDEVVLLSSDTLLAENTDSLAQKSIYQPQIKEIKSRLQDAGKLTGLNLSKINQLLATASSLAITVTDLRTQTADQLEQSGKLALSKQEPYLWEAPFFNGSGISAGNLIVSSYRAQQEILKYFINSTWDKRFTAILLAIAFFIWTQRNFRSAGRANLKQQLGEIKFEYLKPLPIFATLIVLLNITPLFEPDAPGVYIELVQLLLLWVMTIHLWKALQPRELKFWLVLNGLFLLLVLGNAAVDQGFPLRSLLLGINIFFIWFGIQLYRKVRFKAFSKKSVRAVITVLVVFNMLAIGFNLFGRVDLAKMLSVTGVIGLTQLIGLSVFIQIMLDAFELQIKISSCNNGLFSRINRQKSRTKIKKALGILCTLLWLMVFLINLSLIAGLTNWLADVLSKTRSFGSIHFSFGNILFFVAIVYVANKLQKHVPLLFGQENITFEGGNGQKGSKVALVRLIIILVGVLLAVMASGLPMDKLTVILGAFGVGIGLGMQNIVNNFVSGIILIFEKPFQIGDYVELADKKGKVRDIGIRSSKLLTPQGSEVIIPNGDLLSGRLVNWTPSNDYIKTELIFKVPQETEMDAIEKIVADVAGNLDNTIKKLPPEILLNNLSADSVEIKVLMWISSIYVEAEFKSKFLQGILSRFRSSGIKTL